MGIFSFVLGVGTGAYAVQKIKTQFVISKYHYLPLVTHEEWKGFVDNRGRLNDFILVVNEVIKEDSAIQRMFEYVFALTKVETYGIRTEVDAMEDVIRTVPRILTEGNLNSCVTHNFNAIRAVYGTHRVRLLPTDPAIKEMRKISTGFAEMTRWEAFCWELIVSDYRDVAYRRVGNS